MVWYNAQGSQALNLDFIYQVFKTIHHIIKKTLTGSPLNETQFNFLAEWFKFDF